MHKNLGRKVDFERRMIYVDGEIDADILYFKAGEIKLFNINILSEANAN